MREAPSSLLLWWTLTAPCLRHPYGERSLTTAKRRRGGLLDRVAAVGTHPITAAYGRDAAFLASPSAVLTQQVQ